MLCSSDCCINQVEPLFCLRYPSTLLNKRRASMSDQRISETQMRGFRSAVESLKLYRRADLHDPDQGSPLIEELYVDPLPHEDVLRTAIRPHTTFVIGRKGTGKSTIFQRLQHELRKGGSSTSAYLDIKTIFESSQPDQALISRLESRKDALPQETIEKLALYREFLKATVTQVQEELKRRIKSSIWERIKESLTQTYAEGFYPVSTDTSKKAYP